MPASRTGGAAPASAGGASTASSRFCARPGCVPRSAAAVVRRHAWRRLSAVAGLLAVWNLALMGAAQKGIVPNGRDARIRSRLGRPGEGRPWLVRQSLQLSGQPVFALRNGVSPGAYDLLSTNRFLGDPLQPYGRIDVGNDDDWVIADGWHAAEHDGAVTFRWASDVAPAPRAARPRGLAARTGSPSRVRLRRAPAQTFTIATARQSCGPLPVGFGWDTWSAFCKRTPGDRE